MDQLIERMIMQHGGGRGCNRCHTTDNKNSLTSELARESRRIPLLTTATATAAIVISAAEEENQDDPDTVIVATATVSTAESSAATATAQ